MTSPKSSNNELSEKELCDLLDSALDDFCRQSEESKANNESLSSSTNDASESKVTSANLETDSKKNVFDFDSFVKENEQYKLFESDPELKKFWSKLIKSCNEPVENFDTQFRDSLHDTLKTFSEKAKEIAGNENEMSEDEIAKTLANLAELSGDNSGDEQGSGDPSFDLNKIMPLMSNIMENLLSRDFLYPTLSDLKGKFPEYLEQNKATLSKDDCTRYEKQYEIIAEICEEFESEKEDDSTETKQSRFNRILALMQNMQSYGTPPPCLVSPAAQNPFPDFNNIHNNMANTNNCAVM